jgi:hypothetical protein
MELPMHHGWLRLRAAVRRRTPIVLTVAVLVTGLLGCDKKKPDADVDELKRRYQCDVTAQPDADDRERCRLVSDFARGTAFEKWPEDDAIDTWLGRQYCVPGRGVKNAFPVRIKIKRGQASESVIRINGFENFSRLPYSYADDTGDYDILREATNGPPFSPAAVAHAKKPHSSNVVYFPLGPAGNSVASPNSYWRSTDDRLIVVDAVHSRVTCVLELWKL